MGAGGGISILQSGTGDTTTVATPAPGTDGGGGETVSGADLVDGAAPLAEFVRSQFPTPESRLLATLAALLLLVAVVVVVRRAGPRLKDRFDGAVVESAQTAAVAATASAVGAFLILLWGGLGVVKFLLAPFEVSSGDVLLVVLTAVVFAGAYGATRLTKRAIGRLAHDRVTITDHQREILHHTTQIGVYALALMVVLSLWTVNLGGLLAGAGFLGIVLGLAARQTLGAVLAGFVVLFSRPFELGDWVVIDDREGVVSDVSIFNTQLRTFDDEYVMIPNDAVTDSDIVNRSRAGRLRLNLDVGVDYATDIEEAVDLAEGAMAGHDAVLEQPEPEVVLSEFGDSAVVLRLRYYIDTPSARKMWKARTDVITDVKRAFDEAGVKIPFPQRELSGRAETGGFRVDAAAAGSDGDGGDDG
ncbi:mechanosensitive ion channel family protein [Candidatus Halobonum tyrrellensis]|uniref:Mechanosensitive ion channel protein MscS n=1 Tax=Candidatus Halobonum tyrrellensis G22 TaxID=1324957 RepID=V4HH12_9EURY|nr:mechanosensitive ion channel family protein [Candidatus Halobonum tyrrellensis]ESP87134.1 mechanosensitive ion channel protein MscS [Candidatus Halobonum tyrrellensis G22]